MKVLMISTDRKILEEGSAVRARMIDYGTICDELHIIIFSLRRSHPTGGAKISDKVWVYPTASWGKWAYMLDAYILGRTILRARQIDLISAQNPFETGIVGWLLSRVRSIRLDVQLHTDPWSPYFVKSHFLNRLRLLMARFIFPRADSVRVVSGRLKEKVRALVSPDIPVNILPIFVDTALVSSHDPVYDLHTELPQFKRIILALSRLEPEKDVITGIRAMKEVIAEFPEAGLVISGEGSDLTRLKREVLRLGLERNVIFRGWLNPPFSALKTCDIFLLTSLYEGFAMTLVEAAAAGKPIVATNVGLTGDILKNGEEVLVCEPGDFSCISSKIKSILRDDKLRVALAGNALVAVRGRLPRNKESYLKLYRESWGVKR